MNRRLSPTELEVAREILKKVRKDIETASNGDMELKWALRRKISKELIYDERGKPMQRRLLKLKLFAKQLGKCNICRKKLPERGSVLDRHHAMKGYVIENVILICSDCDIKKQSGRGYA